MHHALNSACCLPSCRLDAILSALSQAVGRKQLDPWSTIHPDGSVKSLKEALDSKHDDFYRNLPKFKFLHCIDHYATGE